MACASHEDHNFMDPFYSTTKGDAIILSCAAPDVA